MYILLYVSVKKTSAVGRGTFHVRISNCNHRRDIKRESHSKIRKM